MGFCSKGQPFFRDFYENSSVSLYLTFISSMPILFCWLQTGICQSFRRFECSSIKIYGRLKTKWMKEQFKDFQGLEKDS